MGRVDRVLAADAREVWTPSGTVAGVRFPIGRPYRALLAVLLLATATGCSAPSTPGPAGSAASTGPDLVVSGRPVTVPGLPMLGAAPDRLTVSCASRNFCVLVDETGLSWTWRGSAWTGPVRYAPAGDFQALVSCPGTSFCMAAAARATYITTQGTTWTRTAAASWPLDIDLLACAGPKFCLAGPATTAATNLRAWNGTAWAGTPAVDAGDNPVSLTCSPTGGTCATIAKTLWLYQNGSWTEPFFPRHTPLGVSCPTATFCMVALDDDYAVWTGGTWRESTLDYGMTLGDVSCASASFCLGVNKLSTEVWNGTAWAPGDNVPSPKVTYLFSVAGFQPSCPESGWCMAAATGAVYLYTATP